MDILIQQVDTNCFWDNSHWVPDIAAAHKFPSSASAIEFCVKHRLRGVRLVLHFENPEDDIYLKPFRDSPLPAEQAPSYDTDAKLAELAALKEALLEQETRMQSEIDDITRRIDSLHQRLQFATKAARLRGESTDAAS